MDYRKQEFIQRGLHYKTVYNPDYMRFGGWTPTFHHVWKIRSSSQSRTGCKHINIRLTNPVFNQVWTIVLPTAKSHQGNLLPRANARQWEHQAVFCLKAWRRQPQKQCENIREKDSQSSAKIRLGTQRVNNL